MIFVEGGKESIFESYFDASVTLAFQIIGKDVRDELVSKHLSFSESSYDTLLRDAIIACQNGFCSPTTPLLIMDELFESVPIAECEAIWNDFKTHQKDISALLHLDEKRYSLTSLAVLKLVNSLLHRTCQLRDCAFRGSLMMFCCFNHLMLRFLSNILSFEEKSGLNIANQFSQHPAPRLDPPDVVKKTLYVLIQGVIDRDNGSKDNYTELYSKFWRLQEILCNRDYVTKDVLHWEELHQLINFVVKKIGEIKELSRAGDLELESLGLEKIYLNLQPQEFDGKRVEEGNDMQIQILFSLSIPPERACF